MVFLQQLDSFNLRKKKDKIFNNLQTKRISVERQNQFVETSLIFNSP